MGKCHNSIIVNAPVDKVWETIRNFHDMGWAAGVVESCEVVGDAAGTQLGAKRILNGAFHETLIGLSDNKKSITYSIDDGPGPVATDAVNNYVGQVNLFAVTSDNTTLVQWTSRYDSPDPQAVGDLCNPIYVALLNVMQAHFA